MMSERVRSTETTDRTAAALDSPNAIGDFDYSEGQSCRRAGSLRGRALNWRLIGAPSGPRARVFYHEPPSNW
jgi:hypothetical protein